MTLNMLRTCRQDPTISAYEALNGKFDYNKTPMAPLGSPAVIYDNPTTRNNFASHFTDAIYVEPSMIHYRNRKYWVPSTHKMRISSSTRIYPDHCKIPTISEADKILIAASDLVTSMKAAVPNTKKEKLRYGKALQDLTAIIKNTQDVRYAPTTTPTVSKSTDATSSRVIQKTPIVHQRRTCHNTPMSEIHEFNNPNRENDTQQQSPPTKPMSLVPNRRRCQPLRVAKKRTVEGQLIWGKRKNVKHTSREKSNH